jgi:hypothetical protein
MTDAERIARLELRVRELEFALSEAIEFVDNYADFIDDDESQPVPNEAGVLLGYLEDVMGA